MRIFIPSHGRSETITTHKLFANAQVSIVVHNEQQADLYRANGLSPIVSGTPLGIVNNRQWILGQMKEGEYCIMLDDNIKRFKTISQQFYHKEVLSKEEAMHKYQIIADEKTVMHIFNDIIDKCEEENIFLAGIRPFSSPYYGRKKWRRNAFIRGKCMIVKRDKNINFGKMKCIEDMEFNCINLLEKGATMRCDYLYPDAPAYGGQAGGLGKLNGREQTLYAECKELMVRYPSLLRYKGWKKSTKLGTDIQLALHSKRQIGKWRAMMVALGKADKSILSPDSPYLS